VQEKVDGYNIRAIFINNNYYAFSRSGYVEAFTTEKIRYDKNLEGLRKVLNAGYVVCGEMLGNTPYTRPTDSYDYKFLVFDLYKDDKFVQPDELMNLANKYNFNAVPYYGVFSNDNIEKLEKLVKELDKKGKEGIVMKNEETRIKYVFGFNEARHFSKAHEMLFDFTPGYLQERAFRAALFYHDFGSSDNLTAINNIIDNAKKGIEKFINKGYVYSIYRFKVYDLSTWEDIKKRLKQSREIGIKELSIDKSNDGFNITFERIYKKTTNKLKLWLNGKAFED
jgi:putative ATP-dependent DNA ligase